MKILSLFLLLLTLTGCSTPKKAVVVDPEEYLRLNKIHGPKHKACNQQISEVLRRAIRETEDAELGDENYFFVRDEAKALAFLNNFDIKKFTLRENQIENEAIVMACVTSVSKSYKSCNTVQPAFNYFRGIIYALRQYQWSQKTRDLAIAQTLQYLEYVGQSESSLMDIFFANDLLMRLSDMGYVPTTMYQETIGFRKQGELVHKELRKLIKKLSKKELTCADAQDFYQGERKKVRELSKNFLVMLGNAK